MLIVFLGGLVKVEKRDTDNLLESLGSVLIVLFGVSFKEGGTLEKQ